MLTPIKKEILQINDLSHEARRFRTILWSFERNMDLLFQDTGLAPHVNQEVLAQAFAHWRQAFDKAHFLAGDNRRGFVIFAAGLMLQQLIAVRPLGTLPVKDVAAWPEGVDHRLKRWPEGYAYTSYCLSVAAAILREIGADEPQAETADDPAFWDSFRENSLKDPARAIAFFDLVCGETPNWDAPDVPWLRKQTRTRVTQRPQSNSLN